MLTERGGGYPLLPCPSLSKTHSAHEPDSRTPSHLNRNCKFVDSLRWREMDSDFRYRKKPWISAAFRALRGILSKTQPKASVIGMAR